jgi:UDP:flavonoid glycosyltransferase YjiC (YdhE family)
VNEVLGDLGQPPLDTLAGLFEADEDFLCTFAELDHHPRTDARYWGPLFAADEGVAPRWPEGTGPRVFAYVSPGYRDFDKLVGHLRDLPCRSLVHARGLTDRQLAKYEARNVRFSPEPVRMAEACREADLVICHGGHGTTAAALLAGRPVLLLHVYLEQLLLAHNVVEQGLGKTVTLDSKSPSYKQLVRDLLSDPRFGERARAFAAKYADFDPARQHDLIVARCEAIAAGPPGTP